MKASIISFAQEDVAGSPGWRRLAYIVQNFLLLISRALLPIHQLYLARLRTHQRSAGQVNCLSSHMPCGVDYTEYKQAKLCRSDVLPFDIWRRLVLLAGSDLYQWIRPCDWRLCRKRRFVTYSDPLQYDYEFRSLVIVAVYAGCGKDGMSTAAGKCRP